MKFPGDFLWGSATASYQVEGGIDNNDWARAAKEGIVPRCGRACDHYNLYEKDFDIVVNLSQNAHRISIEWSRIEPEMGIFNESEINHYIQVIRALETRGITPLVTIWHFTLPLWLSEMGGFENRKAVTFFKKYAATVVPKIEKECGKILWATINEPLVYTGCGYMQGKWAPFKKKAYFRAFRVINNLIRAHKAAYTAIKTASPDSIVGVVKNNIFFHVNQNDVLPNPFLKVIALTAQWFWNRRFLNAVRGKTDFIGLNYYAHREFGQRGQYEKSDMGWDICPEGIYHCLMELKRYNKPIYITENGIADMTDGKRAKFIIDHLTNVLRAINDGVPVRGYFYWSLMDNYEWSEGFEKRFGLVEIDYGSLTRRIRPSAYIYKKICETGELPVLISNT